MKKVLLGSTALVAVTALATGGVSAAEPVSLSVGGYLNNHFVIASHSDDALTGGAREGPSIWQEGEVHFKGSTKLDNGISISVQIELEGGSGATGDDIDESYITLSSDTMGSVIIGSENLPDYKMGYGAPVVSSIGLCSGYQLNWVGDPTGSTAVGAPLYWGTCGRFGANDPQAISYYSPRLGGFQLGLGYAPDTSQGRGYATGFENGVSVGLNYVADFDGFGIAASVGMMRWAETATNTLGNVKEDDSARKIAGGLNLSFAGFTVGGAYADYNNDRGALTTNSIQSANGEAFEVGASYATGPYTVSIGYARHEGEGVLNAANAGDNELTMWDVAGTYALSAGVNLAATVQHDDYDGDTVGTSDDREGWLFDVGINLSF